MAYMIISGEEALDSAKRQTLHDVCISEPSIEDLICAWVRSDRSLAFVVPDPDTRTSFCAAFQEKGKDIARVAFPLAEIVRHYKKPPPLNESTYDFADKDGYTADIEWFEKRNKRMGIRWSDELGLYLFPASALAPLVLSYCLSTAGMASIETTIQEDSHYRIRDYFKLTLVFFGKDMEKGWHEEIYISENRFKDTMRKKATASSAAQGQCV